MTTWYPIAKAPRDGTAVLGHIPSKKGFVARQDVIPMYWCEWGGGTWTSVQGHRIHDKVTHYTPIPDPPSDIATSLDEADLSGL